MRTTELGAEFGARTPSRDDLVFRSDVQALITNAMADVEKRLQQSIRAQIKEPKAPVVNIAAPPAPNVTVNAEAPEMETVTVELPGIDKLVKVLTDLKTLMAKPIVRTIDRDANGYITRVTESR